MFHRITLPCQVEVTVATNQLLAVQQGNELSFSFGGLSNDPINKRYPLFSLGFYLEHDAQIYGDGFQMSCQSFGTFDNLRILGDSADSGTSMRVYPSGHLHRFYNYLVIGDSLGYTLFGFTSCHRFAGFFEIVESEGRHQIVAYIDGENSSPREWSTYELESVVVLKSTDLNQLYDEYSDYICQHHQPKISRLDVPPVGWSTQHSSGELLEMDSLLESLSIQQSQYPNLEYVLIDRGYQHLIGDWSDGIEEFKAKLLPMIEQIRLHGKRPGLWLAPFLVEPNSALFSQHPEWFVSNGAGSPLRTDEVTAAGIDGKACYVLDTTSHEVQEHLSSLFEMLSREVGIELFKLDGLFWGTLQGHRDAKGITSIEAYRMGLQAINDAVGDAYVLLNRAPLWASLGLADGMRVTDNAVRDERQYEQNAITTFLRGWQHGKLWQVDPERLVLTSLANQGCERRYYDFHRTVHLASGGVLFSGDPLDDITPFAKNAIKLLVERHKTSALPAQFSSLTLHHASLLLAPHNELHCLFNYNQPIRGVMLTANTPVNWYDYWSGEKLNQVPTQAFEVMLDSGLSARAIVSVG